MPEFKLPPVSPLGGATFSVFFNVLRGKKIARYYYSRLPVTVILLLVCSLFHWIDHLYFRFRKNRQKSSEPPVFILGHWRSGTTLLHNLLTRDPDAAFVTTYHAVFPNNLKSQWLLRPIMRTFMPEVRPGDNVKLAVHYPQEDEYALSNLTHMAYYHVFYFPQSYHDYYSRYVRFQGVPAAKVAQWERIYEKIVEHALDDTGGKRPVLKNPVNTGRIRNLLSIYPEARFVFIMRNPVITYLSSKKFFSQLYPTVNLEEFTNCKIIDMVIDAYDMLLHDYLREKQKIPTSNLIEIRYEDFEQNPLPYLRDIYSGFRLENYDILLPKFQDYIDSQQSHKIHQYTIQRWELDLVLHKLDFAMKQWNYIVPEDLVILD